MHFSIWTASYSHVCGPASIVSGDQRQKLKFRTSSKVKTLPLELSATWFTSVSVSVLLLAGVVPDGVRMVIPVAAASKQDQVSAARLICVLVRMHST